MNNDLDTLLKLLMAVGSLVFFCGGIWTSRDWFLILLRKGSATGRVIDTRFIRKQGSDSDGEAYVLVSFETPDQRMLRFEQAAPSGFFTVHSAQTVQSLKGRIVEVYYDQKKPKRASITPIRDCFWGILMSLLGLLIFLAITVAWGEINF